MHIYVFVYIMYKVMNSKVTQQIMALSSKPDDLSLVPRIHMIGGEN